MEKVERLVADNPQEMIWLRFKRLKSINICESLIKEKI